MFFLGYYLTLAAAQSLGLLSIAIRSMQIALILAPSLVLLFMIVGGFYIPYESIHAGVRWLSWLSFARYGYSSLLVNEYKDRELECAPDVSIQVGTSDECPFPGDEVL